MVADVLTWRKKWNHLFSERGWNVQDGINHWCYQSFSFLRRKALHLHWKIVSSWSWPWKTSHFISLHFRRRKSYFSATNEHIIIIIYARKWWMVWTSTTKVLQCVWHSERHKAVPKNAWHHFSFITKWKIFPFFAQFKPWQCKIQGV